jgi:hypothetical protein
MKKPLVVAATLSVAVPLIAVAGPASQAASHSAPTSVLAWNATAVSTVLASGQFQAQGMAHLAYVQAAVYDAVVAVEGKGRPYVGRLRASGSASLDAAVATSAYDILSLQYPAQAGVYGPAYVSTLAGIADGPGKDEGVAIGHQAAADVVAARAGDGLEAKVPYTFGSGPGVWVLPTDNPATTPQTPWVGAMRPFLVEGVDEYLPDPQPALTSARYARDFEETKDYGSKTSTVRSPDQTLVARFWSANINTVYNATARSVAATQHMDATDAARLLALTDLVGADSLIACMNAKYHYSAWRPFTAIRNADTDGNPATTADPTWTPLLVTPNHPEYPAAHGCITAAEGEVLAAVLDTRHIGIDVTSPVTATTRHFSTVAALESEVVDARVWGGLHFRTSVEVGMRLGREVAQDALDRFPGDLQ